jgi:hypothetical protein
VPREAEFEGLGRILQSISAVHDVQVTNLDGGLLRSKDQAFRAASPWLIGRDFERSKSPSNYALRRWTLGGLQSSFKTGG